MGRKITIISLDPATTDEADLRRTLANKLKGAYQIDIYPQGSNINNRVRVGVIEQRDIDTVLASFDVINRETSQWFNGKSVWDML